MGRKISRSPYKLPSNRAFGLFCSAGFLTVAGWSFFVDSAFIGAGSSVFAMCFLLITLCKDEILLPLNRAWMKFGILLGLIVNPFVLGILYFGMISPIAIVMRIFGRDELKIKKVSVSSYWEDHDISDLPEDTFKNQF